MALHVQLLEGVRIDGGSFLPASSDKRGKERQHRAGQLRVLRSLVSLRPIETVIRLEVFAEREVRREARCLRVLVVQRGMGGARQGVLHPTIALAAGQTKAKTGNAHLGQIQRELVGLGAIVAEAQRCVTTPFAARLAGDEVHGTGQRIAPIQRALRAAEHFDAL